MAWLWSSLVRDDQGFAQFASHKCHKWQLVASTQHALKRLRFAPALFRHGGHSDATSEGATRKLCKHTPNRKQEARTNLQPILLRAQKAGKHPHERGFLFTAQCRFSPPVGFACRCRCVCWQPRRPGLGLQDGERHYNFRIHSVDTCCYMGFQSN